MELNRTIRRLMAACDVAAAALGATVANIDPELEVAARQIRPKLDDLALLSQQFLEQLEETELYIDARQAYLRGAEE
jgi:hypothetical protein